MITSRRLWLFLVVLVSTSMGCSQSEPPNNAEAIQAIEAAAQQWIDRFTSGDLDGLMALYEPDAFVALHGQPAMRGVDAVRDYFSSRIGTPGASFDIDIEEIQVHGDVAHLISFYWFEVPGENDAPFRDAGRSLLIYKYTPATGWRIYVDIDQATPDVNWDGR